MMKIKKPRKTKKAITLKKNTNQIKAKGISASTFDLIPFKRIESGRIVTKDDGYLKFLQIETKNINGLDVDEQYEVMHKLEILMRIYEYDFAWFTLNFPPDIQSNLAHWRKKIYEAKTAKNEARERVTFEQLTKILWVGENLKNLEFYFQIFATTRQDIENKETLIRKLCGLILGGHEITDEKIEKILFKLCNLNTEI